MKATAMLIERGEVALYTSSGDWVDRIISLATHHSQYTHVEVVVSGSGETIGAHGNGIDKGHLPDPNVRAYTLIDLHQLGATDEGIANGLSWVEQQFGKQYGWLDIVFQAIKFLWPNNPFQLVEKDHWDCSDFACRYMHRSGAHMPPDYDDCFRVTPHDLAVLAGLETP
jgi:hypothetical protein